VAYLAELTGWRAAVVDSVAFEIEQRLSHGVTLSALVLVRVEMALRERQGGRGRGPLDHCAG